MSQVGTNPAGGGIVGGIGPARRRAAAIIVCLGLGGLGAVVADKLILPDLFPKRFGVVVEGKLYRSGELTPAAMRKVVRERGIRTVIDLGAHEPGTPEETRDRLTAEALGVTRYRFDLEGDARGNPNNYVQALRLASDPANQPVLIHCSAGTQRTGCAVALYREIFEGVPQDEAIDEARQYDHDPADNPHLTGMLETYRGDIERALREGGQIPTQEALPEPVPTTAPSRPTAAPGHDAGALDRGPSEAGR